MAGQKSEKSKTRQEQQTSPKATSDYLFLKGKKLKILRRERSINGMMEEMNAGLTASVALVLLQARCSQLSLWFLSSGVQEARKALWMTRLGVFVKEKARVT